VAAWETAHYQLETGLKMPPIRKRVLVRATRIITIEIQYLGNPTNDRIYLTNISNDLIGQKLYLMDGLGRVITSKIISNNVEKVELSALNSGVYFVSIGNDFKKIIKL
jgi:hypothetical protein